MFGAHLFVLALDCFLSCWSQENRYLTDLRTGAAGAVSVKHLTKPSDTKIGFIGCGAIAKVHVACHAASALSLIHI